MNSQAGESRGTIILRIAGAPSTENSAVFHQGMVDRMSVSYHKYGAVADAKGKVDEVASLILRLAKYAGSELVRHIAAQLPGISATGNTEFLMDVANIAMIEFMHHPAAYRPTDSRESPGRVWLKDEFDTEPEISQRANDGSVLA